MIPNQKWLLWFWCIGTGEPRSNDLQGCTRLLLQFFPSFRAESRHRAAVMDVCPAEGPAQQRRLCLLIQSSFIPMRSTHPPVSARKCAAPARGRTGARSCERVLILLSSKSRGCDLSFVIALQFPSHLSCFVQTAGPAGRRAGG